MTDGFQLEGPGPQAYERYLVPAFFGPCADELLALAAPVAGERVLDLACGTGVVARRLAARVGAAGAVTGVDINEQMVAFAASAIEGRAAVAWHTADAARLPLADAAFDLVCCQQGLSSSPTRPGRCARPIACSSPVGASRWPSGARSSTTQPSWPSPTPLSVT